MDILVYSTIFTPTWQRGDIKTRMFERWNKFAITVNMLARHVPTKQGETLKSSKAFNCIRNIHKLQMSSNYEFITFLLSNNQRICSAVVVLLVDSLAIWLLLTSHAKYVLPASLLLNQPCCLFTTTATTTAISIELNWVIVFTSKCINSITFPIKTVLIQYLLSKVKS